MSPPSRLARTASAIASRERLDAGRQVLGEPDAAALAVASASGSARWLWLELDAEERARSPSLYVLEVGIALAGDHERVEVAARLEPEAVADRLLEEAQVEADVVADDQRVADELEELRGGLGGGRRLGTSLSVRPCIWLPTIVRPGLTRVDQRSVILPPLTLTAAISRRSAIFGSRPVVSTSTTTNSRWPRRPSTKSRTDSGARLEVRHALGLADGLPELLLEVDERLERAMAEQDRLGHHVLGQDLGAGLDHHDRVAGAGDDQVELGLRELGVGRVDDELAVDPADADGADRAPGTGSR